MDVPDTYINATEIAQAAGKNLSDWLRNKYTKVFLEDLTTSLGEPLPLIHQQRRHGRYLATLVHPKVAEHLKYWCTGKRKRKSTTGYVYLVTSPLMSVVKIGCWTGSIANLTKRYLTPYGPDLQVDYVETNDCVGAEGRMHAMFRHFNKGGELFDNVHIDKYIKALRNM